MARDAMIAVAEVWSAYLEEKVTVYDVAVLIGLYHLMTNTADLNKDFVFNRYNNYYNFNVRRPA